MGYCILILLRYEKLLHLHLLILNKAQHGICFQYAMRSESTHVPIFRDFEYILNRRKILSNAFLIGNF